MSSVVRKLGGTPLTPKTVYNELETGCDRAVPDNDYTAQKMQEFFSLSDEDQKSLGRNSRLNFEKYYQWEKTAKKWEDYFDSVEIKPDEETWKSPARIHQPSTNVPAGLSAAQYARWLISEVLGEPEKLNTFFESRLIRDLNYGMFVMGTGESYLNEDSYKFVRPQFEKFEKEDAYKMMVNLCKRRNQWESIRKENIK